MNGLKVTRETGVGQDIKEREAVFGDNKRAIREPKSYLELLCEALSDFTMRILMVAAVVEIGEILM